jgi:excisionase family DNA binding protein
MEGARRMKTIFEPEDLAPFREMFREIVKEEMKAVLSGKGTQEDQIMDVSGLCKYLSVTPKWIHERTHLKEIPFCKLSNKQLRFRKRAIDKWLESLSTPAIGQYAGKLRAIR